MNGACTVSNFNAAVGSTKLATLLGTSNAAQQQTILDTKCAAALEPSVDLVTTIEKGPQFLKNYLDGGSTWNDNTKEGTNYVLSQDAAIVNSVYNSQASNTIFGAPDGGSSVHYPRYFSNFYKGDQECRLGVIQCCYTDARDGKLFSGNTDMCALDMTGAAKSNHIKAMSMTYYDTTGSTNQAYCSSFAYEKDSFGDAVKYNSLFHMAMKTNLYDNGLVKNIPGAPLCGCLEQMPIVTNSRCVKAVEGYKIDNSGKISVSISWQNCGDMATYYDTLDNRTDTEKFFVKEKIVGTGQCDAAADSFMNDRMYIKL